VKHDYQHLAGKLGIALCLIERDKQNINAKADSLSQLQIQGGLYRRFFCSEAELAGTIVPPYSLIQYPLFTAAPKMGKLKKQTVYKFENARHARTDRNMVKSNSPKAPST
jgi:hypothetical protein